MIINASKMSPSYSYGERGFDIISRYIYVVTPVLEDRTGVSHTAFDNYEAIVVKILLPEVVAVVISEDYECSLDEGYHLGWLSELYGDMEYPQDHKCPVLKSLYGEGTKEIRALLQGLERGLGEQ